MQRNCEFCGPKSMSPAPLKKLKAQNSSVMMVKTNKKKPVKMITRSKKLIVEKHPVSKKPVKVNKKVDSTSRRLSVDRHQSGKSLKSFKAPHALGKSHSSGSSTSSKLRGKCTQCDTLDEKVKRLEQAINTCQKANKKMLLENSSLKNQMASFEEWKKSVEVEKTHMALTNAKEINLDKLIEAEINPKVIEAELINRKISKDSDIWLKFHSLVETQEEKIKKQKIKDAYLKKLQEKRLLEKQIADLNKDIEITTEKNNQKLNTCSTEIESLKKEIYDIGIYMIDTEFSVKEEAQMRFNEIPKMQKKIEEDGKVANEMMEKVKSDYKLFTRAKAHREANPIPPCEICANQKEECQKWEQLHKESVDNLADKNAEWSETFEKKWNTTKREARLRFRIPYYTDTIMGHKLLHENTVRFTNQARGWFHYAKADYHEAYDWFCRNARPLKMQ